MRSGKEPTGQSWLKRLFGQRAAPAPAAPQPPKRIPRLPPSLPESEFPQLVAAYRELLPLLDQSTGYLARRHELLFCFGFDETGILPEGATTSAEQLKDYIKLITQCQKYTSLPG